jgi:arginase
MAAAIPGFQPIDPSRCLLVDARDLDPNEAKLLNTLPVLRAQCSGVPDKVEWLKSAEVERTHLHVDLDVLDPRKLQVNRYASAGGPSPEQLSKTVASLARSVPVVGLTVTAYDPAFDGQGEVPPVVGRLMVDFLAALERI